MIVNKEFCEQMGIESWALGDTLYFVQKKENGEISRIWDTQWNELLLTAVILQNPSAMIVDRNIYFLGHIYNIDTYQKEYHRRIFEGE